MRMMLSSHSFFYLQYGSVFISPASIVSYGGLCFDRSIDRVRSPPNDVCEEKEVKTNERA
jgi:hypothetical protein